MKRDRLYGHESRISHPHAGPAQDLAALPMPRCSYRAACPSPHRQSIPSFPPETQSQRHPQAIEEARSRIHVETRRDPHTTPLAKIDCHLRRLRRKHRPHAVSRRPIRLRNKTHELRSAPKHPILVPIAPIVEHRPRYLMAPRDIGQCHAVAMAFFNNPDLLIIRPTASTTRVGNR